ncbi:heavy metal translocating P-type ATPase [Oceanirhabdus sp. W0125-5]|uniref:heavy metal translocating P-type ATPase n=1 Tax=Oceanirhabdus sp. W0125-5 TaxID=2999116 RepID=UPI0022F2EB65|nr:heavy metal translocating P-type ATPase [Oceanirhabdus sp. W0125-5]WBW95036.1 heavy metal translocating P-type ATPase [Oceanirhabdus sp. W0125-5]
MVKNNSKKSLFKCEVVHTLSGRIRLKCFGFEYLKDKLNEIEEKLNSIVYFNDVSISYITNNILLFYDPKLIDSEEIIETVEAVVASYSIEIHKAVKEQKDGLDRSKKALEYQPLGDKIKKIGVTAATIAYYGIRKKKGLPVEQLLNTKSVLDKFTTVPALVSLGLSRDILKNGVVSLIKDKRANEDTLTTTAIVTSLFIGGDISALTTILLSDIAELLTSYTMNRTRKAIRDMLDVGDQYVWKKSEDGQINKVNINKINKDDIIVVHSGEKISVDGEVVLGEGVVDQSSITGEFMPILRIKGQNVFAGTILKSGTLTIRATKVGDETAVSRIVNLVEEASNNKAQMQIYADKFASQLLPLNFSLAALVYIATKDVKRALNMLVIDYACGARLSTAAALSASIHTAAKNGVLVKGGNFIESLSESDTLILDKTGTLTEGRPKIMSIITAEDVTEQELIEIASAAEETSTHPLAKAVMSKLYRSGWKVPEHGEALVHAGFGVETIVGSKTVVVGSKKIIKKHDIEISSEIEKQVDKLLERGDSLIYVAHGDKLLGVLGVQDTLRDNMKKSINRLRSGGIDDIILLTGDVEQQAEIMTRKMSLDSFKADLLPEDKAESVLQLQSTGSKVIMVGDGINDAPALAYADVGIAIGATRTDIAVEAADITINSDDPLLIPQVINLSQKTMDVVKQNFATTIGVNTVGLFLGAIGVLPVFGCSLLHNLSTIAVVLNSTRLMFYRFERR